MMTTITAKASTDGAELTITVQGRFDFSALQLFRNTYEKVNPKPTKYIIDLKESDYLDSSALGMLLALRDYAGGDEANIQIINSNPDVKKILVITKLDELFKVE
jgi:HptB-dependent secretion and biofilm anti anti-sigma factor